MEEAAQMVRQIRADLAPRLLEQGLAQPLTDLVKRFQVRTGVATDLWLAPDLDTSLSFEARHALYRVIQQALDNVAAHAHARRVSVSLILVDGQVDFTIVDDGAGFSEMQLAQARERDSFGLRSMQARITALGGELRMISSPGGGTRITGWLPANH